MQKKKKLVEKVQRKDRRSLYCEDKRRKRKAERETDVPKRDKSWEIWKMALSPFASGENWLCVNAAAEGLQKRTEMERWQQQEVQVKESRWAEEIPQRWTQPKRRRLS